METHLYELYVLYLIKAQLFNIFPMEGDSFYGPANELLLRIEHSILLDIKEHFPELDFIK